MHCISHVLCIGFYFLFLFQLRVVQYTFAYSLQTYIFLTVVYVFLDCSNKLMDPKDILKNKSILGHIARRRRVVCALAVGLAAFAASLAASAQEGRRAIRKRKRGEIPFYKRIIYSNETDCHDQIRMSRGAFFHLASILREKGSIKNTVHLTLEEQLVMFLHTLGHNLRNRKISHNFGHLGETISRYFHKVLMEILAFHSDYLLPPSLSTPPKISGKDRFDPYFKVDILSIIFLFS